jgi:hypothetical protein
MIDISGRIVMQYIDWKIVYRETGSACCNAGRLDIYAVLDYVEKTGATELLLNKDDYHCMGGYMKNYEKIAGTTEDGYPFFQILGIKFILLCGDKLKTYNLLK